MVVAVVDKVEDMQKSMDVKMRELQATENKAHSPKGTSKSSKHSQRMHHFMQEYNHQTSSTTKHYGNSDDMPAQPHPHMLFNNRNKQHIYQHKSYQQENQHPLQQDMVIIDQSVAAYRPHNVGEKVSSGEKANVLAQLFSTSGQIPAPVKADCQSLTCDPLTLDGFLPSNNRCLKELNVSWLDNMEMESILEATFSFLNLSPVLIEPITNMPTHSRELLDINLVYFPYPGGGKNWIAA